MSRRLNKWTIKGVYAYTDLVHGRCYVSRQDLKLVQEYTWISWTRPNYYTAYATTRTYDKDTKKYMTIYMARLLMGFPKDLCVDHINRNGLDNRKNNLRLATRQENCYNVSNRRRNKLGLKGIHFLCGAYKVQISKDGCRFCKDFKKKNDAIDWYNMKAKELFGNFAVLNK